MATTRIFISYIDPNPDCFRYFIVEYKAAYDITFSRAPDAYSNPIVIEGFEEGVEYTIRITKICCDGTQSAPTTTTYTPVTSDYFYELLFQNDSTDNQNILVQADIQNPVQYPVVPTPFILEITPSSSYLTSRFPISGDTTIPMTGNITVQNVGDFNMFLEITVVDGSGTQIPDSDTETIYYTWGPGASVTFTNFTYGTSPDGIYRVKFTITDPV